MSFIISNSTNFFHFHSKFLTHQFEMKKDCGTTWEGAIFHFNSHIHGKAWMRVNEKNFPTKLIFFSSRLSERKRRKCVIKGHQRHVKVKIKHVGCWPSSDGISIKAGNCSWRLHIYEVKNMFVLRFFADKVCIKALKGVGLTWHGIMLVVEFWKYKQEVKWRSKSNGIHLRDLRWK